MRLAGTLAAAGGMTDAAVEIERTDKGATLRLTGRVVIAALSALEPALCRVPGGRPVAIDLSGVESLDTGGAWRILQLKARLEGEGSEVAIRGASRPQEALLDTVARSLPSAEGEEEPPRGLLPWLGFVGERTVGLSQAAVAALGFLGLVLARLGRTIVQPRRLRVASLVHHMQEVGLNAVPIVALMAFLIGIVLAFQGSAQLRPFGAEVFVVNLIAISVLRELGILLTAIIVAGRSGSAFTASIGSMKVREEIDAMRTLGLDPIEVLVLPRVLALVIMLPALGFIADVVGLLGGALMSWIELDVSPGMFLARLRETTDIWHFAIGMIKAPFFAVLIGVTGCYKGMRVEGSAESVGRLTTSSVVVSIFGVIVLDAIFSIFFAEVGL